MDEENTEGDDMTKWATSAEIDKIHRVYPQKEESDLSGSIQHRIRSYAG